MLCIKILLCSKNKLFILKKNITIYSRNHNYYTKFDVLEIYQSYYLKHLFSVIYYYVQKCFLSIFSISISYCIYKYVNQV